MRLSTNMMFDQQMRGVSNAQSSWLKAGSSSPPANGLSTRLTIRWRLRRRSCCLRRRRRTASTSWRATSPARAFRWKKVRCKTSLWPCRAHSRRLFLQATARFLTTTAPLTLRSEGIRSQLLNPANSTDGNGRYIFAGYKSDSAPFTEDANGSIVYNGGTDAITQKVDASRTMTTSHTGAQVFMSLTSNAVKEPNNGVSESNIFNTLDTAINALKQPIQNADDATKAVSKDALDKATRGLSNSLNNILAVRSELGTQLDELDKLDSLGADRSTLQATRMSGLVDVDYTKAISTYTMQQQALQASYKTFSDMSQMSLFQMNR